MPRCSAYKLVKVWHEGNFAKEMLYDIACSDGGSVDPTTQRCPDNGATVDLTDCSISTDSGAPELKTLWQDPDFDPNMAASYYVRVLENPTCRWSTWDALKAGVERCLLYTSPSPRDQRGSRMPSSA